MTMIYSEDEWRGAPLYEQDDEEDHEAWARKMVIVRPPYTDLLKAKELHRYDIVNKLSKRMGLAGTQELKRVSQTLIWDLYELTADSFDLENLRAERAEGFLRAAVGRHDQLALWELHDLAGDLRLEQATARVALATLEADLTVFLLGKLEPKVRALIGQALGDPVPSRGRRNGKRPRGR